GGQPGQVLDGPDGGKQPQLAAQLDVVVAQYVVASRLVARFGQQPGLQRQPRFLDGLEQRGWQRRPAVLKRGPASEVLVPVDGDAGGVKDFLDCRHLVEAAAASLDQSHTQAHGRPFSRCYPRFAISCSVSVAVLPSPLRSAVKPLPA